MKLALIGCGRWGKNLARVFHELGVLEMVCDPVLDLPADPKGIQGRYAIDAAMAFRRKDITAVAIATPSAMHCELAIQAMQAGKDVFVEKPMALSYDDARRMVTCAKAYDRILMVGHILEYHPAYVELVRRVHAGQIGRVLRVHAIRLNEGRERGAHDTSVLWSFAPHDVALVLRLMGRAPDGMKVLSERSSVFVDMKGGPTACPWEAVIWVDWNWGRKKRGIVVTGTDGVIAYNDVKQTLRHHQSAREGWACTESFADMAEPLRLECEAFIEACCTRVPPLADGTSGAAVVGVLERASHALHGASVSDH